jgi:hypothetical protein
LWRHLGDGNTAGGLLVALLESGTYKTVKATYTTVTARYKTVTATYKTVTAAYKTVMVTCKTVKARYKTVTWVMEMQPEASLSYFSTHTVEKSSRFDCSGF